MRIWTDFIQIGGVSGTLHSCDCLTHAHIVYPISTVNYFTLNGFNFILGLKDSEAFLHLAGRRILPVDTEYDPEDILQRSLAAGLLNRLPNVDDEAFGLDVDADVLVFYYQHVPCRKRRP